MTNNLPEFVFILTDQGTTLPPSQWKIWQCQHLPQLLPYSFGWDLRSPHSPPVMKWLCSQKCDKTWRTSWVRRQAKPNGIGRSSSEEHTPSCLVTLGSWRPCSSNWWSGPSSSVRTISRQALPGHTIASSFAQDRATLLLDAARLASVSAVLKLSWELYNGHKTNF